MGIFCILMNTAIAQSSELLVQGASPDIYLEHTVAPKENWYSIGRIYNISPKELAPYNRLTMDKPLSIGQHLKVPLTAGNFSQNGSKAGDELFVPVYHVLQEKEWMFRVSSNYNKVPVENLETWNSINRDQVKTGMKLIVGYLKVKSESTLAARGSSNMKVSQVTSVVATTNKTAAVEQPVVVKKTEQPPVIAKKEPVAVTEGKPEPVVNNSPRVVSNTDGGYFKSLFSQTGQSSSGDAGIFKSSSGWQDGKYYALMNNVPVGSVIKISGNESGKSIYAKVLGQLTDMKENNGLVVRLSDAAAAALEAQDANKLSVQVIY